MSCAIILLAAGGSTRMGRAKQLLPYRDTTLLRHAVGVALESRSGRVVVVIGSQAQKMRVELGDLPVDIVENLQWETGMGSSIKAGMAALLGVERPDALVIMLCDQPGVTAALLDQMIEIHEQQGPKVVASEYGEVAGVPALFDVSLFDELLHLDDWAGARVLIQRHAQLMSTIPFSQGTVDVDTPEEYERLR
jgi:molybdenum cofactor cytidylyltransferase